MSDFDFERAVAGLTGGYGAISSLDQARLARKRADEEARQARALEERAKAEESRRAADEVRKGQDWTFESEERRHAAPFKRQLLELDVKGKSDDVEGKRLTLDTKRAEFDPESEYSKTVRGGVGAQLRAMATTLQQRGAPEAQLYAKAAEKVERNTQLGAAQIMDAVKPLLDAGGFNLKALHDQAIESNAKAQLAQGWAGQAESRRMHDAQISNMEEDNKRNYDITVKRPQEKLNDEIGALEVAKGKMGELAETKKNVNTGPVMNFFLNTLGIGTVDELVSQDRKKLESLQARVFNKETKQLAGVSVSPAEWERIAPMIPQSSDDDETYATKLEAAMQEADLILAEKRKQYQRGPSGKPVDTSITAQEQSAKAKPTMTAEDRDALRWYNDPANKSDPSRAAVGAVLKRKGLIK